MCLRGHNLAIAGVRSSYHHWYALTEITCRVCHSLHDPLASWCLVNPTRQHSLDTAPHTGLALVRIPPATRGGIRQLRLWVDGVARADIDVAICGPCKRGVVEHVRTDEQYRRRGYGRVLVAAALSLAPPADYRWSTTKVADDPVARARSGPVSTGRANSANPPIAWIWTVLQGVCRTGSRRSCDGRCRRSADSRRSRTAIPDDCWLATREWSPNCDLTTPQAQAETRALAW